MTVGQPSTSSAAFLNTVEGEISFFRSLMRARPVGIHRHFHMFVIQNAIFKDTNRLIPIDDLWEKLRSCYDLDALDAIDLEADGYESPRSKNSTPVSIRSPSPSENLSRHPYFREEYSLPYDESFEAIISQRRMRATASAPSTPVPSPAPPPKTRGGKKRPKSKLYNLMGGDSDSSALTQESGDEAAAGTPKGSVVTGTDGGTDEAPEEEDVEMREPSPALSTSPKPTKKGKAGKKGAATGKTRSTAGGSTRGAKKRKR